MCSFGSYDKCNVPSHSDEISGGGIPIPSTSSKKEVYSLGWAIKFLVNWLKLFDDNYQKQNHNL